jgi:hypothetical protein
MYYLVVAVLAVVAVAAVVDVETKFNLNGTRLPH